MSQKLCNILKQSASLKRWTHDLFNTRKHLGSRHFSSTPINNLKEVKISSEGKKTVVEGIYVDESQAVVLPNKGACKEACPLCPLRLGVEVKYTDVLILSQFLRADGCLLPRYTTGVCARGQGRLAVMVRQAQRAGLMPELRPERKGGRDWSKTKSNYKWKQYNIFYGEYGDVH